jgi:lipopolysaccharide export system ATP-binding protein
MTDETVIDRINVREDVMSNGQSFVMPASPAPELTYLPAEEPVVLAGTPLPPERLLECIDLVKDYPGKRAVDGVDFHVMPGEIVGLLGPNGAGKTTSFRMACGMIAPTEGRVLLRGVDVTGWPMYQRARHGMGYLPQDHSIFTKLSVEQNIHAVLEYLPLSRGERRDKVDFLLKQFGLSDKRKQVSSTMSGGEKRRLEIARCLATDPVLILLDEPFTGIDPVTIHSIQDIIGELKQRTGNADHHRPQLHHLPRQGSHQRRRGHGAQ